MLDCCCGDRESASAARTSFAQWIEAFQAKAIAHGVTPETYTRVMRAVEPDTTGLDAIRNQPEFTEQLWQYLNAPRSDWQVITGKAKAKEYAPLFARIEKDYGVEPSFMLGVWGIESAFGDGRRQKSHASDDPVAGDAGLGRAAPARLLGSELINALVIVQRGWGTPEEMIGSWAGAMGHTQWMPEVWLHVGIDYNNDGQISPFGPPDDALASTARYLVERGEYRRGEHWGYEVRVRQEHARGSRSYAEWQKLGVTRADGEPFPRPRRRRELGCRCRAARPS